MSDTELRLDISTPGGEQAHTTLQSLRGDMQATHQSALSMGAAIGVAAGAAQAGFGLMANAAGAALSAISDSAIHLNGKLEQANIAFTTMLGSGEKAAAFLKDLQQFAAQTPFEFPQLVEASKRMLAFGFAADEVRPLLTAVGNAASAMGSGAEGINRITTALGQMQAKGKLQAEEMLQLTEAGIPAWDMLAKKLGTDVSGAMDMVSKRLVDSKTFLDAFQTGVKERFGDMMAEQAKTFDGAMSTVKDSLQMAVAEGFAPFFTILRDVALEGATFLQSQEFSAWAAGVAEGAKGAAQSIRDFGAAAGTAKEAIGGALADVEGKVDLIAGYLARRAEEADKWWGRILHGSGAGGEGEGEPQPAPQKGFLERMTEPQPLDWSAVQESAANQFLEQAIHGSDTAWGPALDRFGTWLSNAITDDTARAAQDAAAATARGTQFDALITAIGQQMAEGMATAGSSAQLASGTQIFIEQFAYKLKQIFPTITDEALGDAIAVLRTTAETRFRLMGEQYGQAVAEGFTASQDTIFHAAALTLDQLATTVANKSVDLKDALHLSTDPADVKAILDYEAAMQSMGKAGQLLNRDLAAVAIAIANTRDETTGQMRVMEAAALIEGNLAAQTDTQAQAAKAAADATKVHTDALKEQEKAAKDVATAMSSGYVSNLQAAYSALTQNLNAMQRSELEVIRVTGGPDGLSNAVKKAFADAGASTGDFLNALSGTTTQARTLGQSVGANLAAGITAGINGERSTVSDSIGNVVAMGLDSAKLRFKITSPSQVFADEVGKPIGEGIAHGVRNTAETITAAVEAAIKPGLSRASLAVGYIMGGLGAGMGTGPGGLPAGGAKIGPEWYGQLPGFGVNVGRFGLAPGASIAADQTTGGPADVLSLFGQIGPGRTGPDLGASGLGLPGGQPFGYAGVDQWAAQHAAAGGTSNAANLGGGTPWTGAYPLAQWPTAGGGGGGGGGGRVGAIEGGGGGLGRIALNAAGHPVWIADAVVPFTAGTGLAQHQASANVSPRWDPNASDAQNAQWAAMAQAEAEALAAQSARGWAAGAANAARLIAGQGPGPGVYAAYTAAGQAAMQALSGVSGPRPSDAGGSPAWMAQYAQPFTGSSTAQASLDWARQSLAQSTDDNVHAYWQSVIDNLDQAFPGLVEHAVATASDVTQQALGSFEDQVRARWGSAAYDAYQKQIDTFNASIDRVVQATGNAGSDANAGGLWMFQPGQPLGPPVVDPNAGGRRSAGADTHIHVHLDGNALPMSGAERSQQLRAVATELKRYL